MGAWGYGLFENDHDHDLASDLSHEAWNTEKAALQKDSKAGGSRKQAEDHDDDEDSILYPEQPELVRDRLDAGILTQMLEKYETKFLLQEGGSDAMSEDYWNPPGYLLVLLAICAMQVGCTIPDKHMRFLKKVYMCVGLSREAVLQIEEAFIGPNFYQNGRPFTLDHSKVPKLPEPQPNASGVIGLNVPGPWTMFYNPPQGSKKGLMELKADFKKKTTGEDVCGGCGTKENSDGKALSSCGACGVRKYCSKECQKKQWKVHKVDCQEVRERAASATG